MNKINKIMFVLIIVAALSFSMSNCTFQSRDYNIPPIFSMFTEYLEALLVNDADTAMYNFMPEDMLPQEFLHWRYYSLYWLIQHSFENTHHEEFGIECISKINEFLYRVYYVVWLEMRVGEITKFRVRSFAGFINERWYIILNEHWIPYKLREGLYITPQTI